MGSDASPTGMPIADAAKHLGVSVELLRKRAQRGTLPSYKVDGRWFINVQDQDESPSVQDRTNVQDVQDRRSWTGHESQAASPAVNPAAFAQLEAIRDQWLKPFVDELNAKSERIGRLEERLAAAERERDDLRRQVDEARDLANLDQSQRVPDNDSVPTEETEHLERVRAYLDDAAKTRKSPQTHEHAPGTTEAANSSPEANGEPFEAHATRFARWWAWIAGR